MPIAPNFTSVLTKDFEINFMQCMPNGYLKYTELCNILQLTAAAHSEVGGISFADMQVFNQAWVLSRMRVEIDKLPKWKTTVTVKTWIVSLENSRSVRALEVYIGEKKIIGCETFWAVFNTKIRRPEALTLPFKHFELFPDNSATLQRVKKINSLEHQKTKGTRTIVLSDLDIVNHVNNIKYLEWCLDLADYKKVINQQLLSFDINFMKELMLNDAVDFKINETSDKTTFIVDKADKTCFALELNWK